MCHLLILSSKVISGFTWLRGLDGPLESQHASCRKSAYSLTISSRDAQPRAHGMRLAENPPTSPRCSNLSSPIFCSICSAPKRTRVGTIGMKLQHSVVEFLRGCRALIEAVEIAEILTRLGDVAGIVVVFRNLMSGDNRSWLQSFKLVERSNPFKPALRVSSRQDKGGFHCRRRLPQQSGR